ncbi:MAG TPA: FkbM family methyltransferase [Pyrinomonadaceae bacterium]|nr:FkbM family methyltransferase [Pyrinomonadaceae bacterium]
MTRLRQQFITVLAPIIRIFPPWWKVRLYMHFADSPFQEGGYSGKVKKRRITPHCYEMELSLDEWMERFAYYVGCYYEIDATATLLRLLRPGDCFIDVGANVGFLSLTASRVVGREGRILAFEPNGALVDRMNQTLLNTKIDNVVVNRLALGDEEGEATLHIGSNSATASLRNITSSGRKVKVVRGDRFINELAEDTWTLVKLDVEGYELRVLRGFQTLIKRPRTAFFVEVTDAWLRDAGGSAKELFEVMRGNQFSSYIPRLTPWSNYELQPIEGPLNERFQYDVIFLRRGECWLSR